MTIVHFSTCRETNKTKNHSKNKHKMKQMIRLYKKEQNRGLIPGFQSKVSLHITFLTVLKHLCLKVHF